MYTHPGGYIKICGWKLELYIAWFISLVFKRFLQLFSSQQLTEVSKRVLSWLN